MAELEEREAASYNGYPWRAWQSLPRQERIDGVAYFRIRRAIEANQHDAVERHLESKRRAAEAKHRGTR